MRLALLALLSVSMSGAIGQPITELWDFGDPAKSEQRLRDALRDAHGDRRLELETQVARTYSLRGRFADAHSVLDALEPRLASAGPRPKLRYLLERGRTFNSAGDKTVARPLFLQAWELGRTSAEQDLAIDAAHMVAIVDGGEQALQWNRLALDLAESSSDPAARRWRAPLLNNIGYELETLGRYDEALAAFEQALVAYRERGDRREIRIARWMIAHNLRLQEKYEAALAIQRDLERELAAEGEFDPEVGEEIAALNKALGKSGK